MSPSFRTTTSSPSTRTPRRQTQLTHDGSDTLLNGVLDWVYQEELYGRGHWRSYWWSDDGRHIAYLQLNEAEVPVYPLVDYLPVHPTTESLRYPKAGDPNPKVRLGVVPPDGGDTVWVDLAQYDGTDILIPRVSWSPEGRVIYGVQDRESLWLDLNAADCDAGHGANPAPRVVAGLGGVRDAAQMAAGWLVPLAQCSRRLAAPVSLHPRWRAAAPGHLRRVGSPRPARHGPRRRLRLLLRDARQPRRNARLPHPTCRQPDRAADRARLQPPGQLRSPFFRYFIDTFSNVTTPTQCTCGAATANWSACSAPTTCRRLREYRLSTPRIPACADARGPCAQRPDCPPPAGSAASEVPRPHVRLRRPAHADRPQPLGR